MGLESEHVMSPRIRGKGPSLATVACRKELSPWDWCVCSGHSSTQQPKMVLKRQIMHWWWDKDCQAEKVEKRENRREEWGHRGENKINLKE